ECLERRNDAPSERLHVRQDGQLPPQPAASAVSETIVRCATSATGAPTQPQRPRMGVEHTGRVGVRGAVPLLERCGPLALLGTPTRRPPLAASRPLRVSVGARSLWSPGRPHGAFSLRLLSQRHRSLAIRCDGPGPELLLLDLSLLSL